MTAFQANTAGFLARFETLNGTLPGDTALRAAAAAAFRAAGLPGATQSRRPEAWKYTALRPLADSTLQSVVRPDITSLVARLPVIDAPRLVFVDGEFRPELSTLPAGSSSLGFSRFADRPDFGTLTWPDREPLVALNTMLATDGATLIVPDGVDAGLVVLASLGSDGGAFHPRHMIRLGAGARLSVLEVSAGSGVYFHNPVTEIHVARGASLTHVRLQDDATTAFHLATIYADIAADATYDSFTLTVGARLARTEMRAHLAGSHATAHLNAAQLLRGNQHADYTSVVRHAEPHGTSRQTVKNVLAGRSRGVFQGRIEVARAAQKTDGYQMNQALLLSPDAEVDAKPELEIFADDVKCSHGATVGELDSEQMFYLRSRGIPDGEARAILVRAFLAEALDAVGDDATRAVLEAAVQSWWEYQTA